MRKSWAEPYKIKMVELLRMTTVPTENPAEPMEDSAELWLWPTTFGTVPVVPVEETRTTPLRLQWGSPL